MGCCRRSRSRRLTPSRRCWQALRGLVKGEWWLPATTIRTDAAGRAQIQGFLGDYRLTAAGAEEALFALEAPGEVSVDVTLPA